MLHVVVGSGGGPQLVAAAAHRAQGAVQVVLELRELVVDVDVALTAQAVGLGAHAGDTSPNENSYRRERARIGAAGGAGVVPGDVGMPLRGDYAP